MNDSDLIPVRYLNEYAYCPRLGYLEWVESEFVDNYYTLDGRFKHKRVDAQSDKVTEEGEGDKAHRRSVYLSSKKLGLTGRIDLVEHEGERATPVEYKRGKVPDTPERAYEPELVQVCAQALLLRESGYSCDRGIIYFIDSKTRIEVDIDEALVSRTLSLLESFRELVNKGEIPAPLNNSVKCIGCSLAKICMPDEVRLLSEAVEKDEEDRYRRLVPARDDAVPVYIIGQGSYVRLDGDCITVTSPPPEQERETIRLIDVSQLNVYGNVQITTQALREFCERSIPVSYFSTGGWFYGITHGHTSKNVHLRIAQYDAFRDGERSLEFARKIIQGKIKNCRTIIRRNSTEDETTTLKALAACGKYAVRANSMEELLGIEGNAAHIYFAVLPRLIKPRGTDELEFNFEGRNRRPPLDPVNAMLSFLYAILVKEITVTAYAVGLDPYLGLMHRPRHGKPALALDLMEEMRPIIVDSVVLTMINNGEAAGKDFIKGMGSVHMSDGLRKRAIRAYERRMSTLIKHPKFGYTISYRRVLEVQARLFSRFLMGEISEYPAFCTR
ncbi:MAG: CRISPR-associated endonuclease Cas1 [Actinobacteria bacterium]|nr:CRISPR-associated endonuclease Cas1 [Actinomycetota bacterium]